jgi:hypothetical protein
MLDWEQIFAPFIEEFNESFFYSFVFFGRDIIIFMGLGTTAFTLIVTILTRLIKNEARTMSKYLAGNILILLITIPMLFHPLNQGLFLTKTQSIIGIILIILGWIITLAFRPRFID